jgi:hypothetical protein
VGARGGVIQHVIGTKIAILEVSLHTQNISSVRLCTQCTTCPQICFIQSISLSPYIYIYIYRAACRAVYRQRLGKHFHAATDMHATIEVLLETVFSIRSVQMGYKEENWDNQVSSLREAVKRGLERGS